MKKWRWAVWLVLLIMALGLNSSAQGGDFTLDEEATIAGMNYLPWARGYEPTSDGENVIVCLPLRSERAAGKIKAVLRVDEASVSPIRGEEVSVEVLPDAKGLYAVKLTARLLSGRVNGDYAATVHVTGQDAQGAALSGDFPMVLRLRDGKTSDQPMRPALENVSAHLRVGEAGTLEGRLVNSDAYAEMRDILLSVRDAGGEVLPGGTDKMRLGDLMPGKGLDFAYPVTVSAKAQVAAHPLTFSLSWTALGEEKSWEETITLPVTQEMRLEWGALQTNDSVVQGDQATVTLPLMNMGRGEVYNVLATLSLSGVCERQSVLVGTIAPGESGTARLSFAAKAEPGRYEGTLCVACEDAWGNETSREEAIALQIEAPVLKEAASQSSETPEVSGNRLVWILGGVCALMALVMILGAALLIKKIHRLEEERL